MGRKHELTLKDLDIAAGQIDGKRDYQEDAYKIIVNKDNHQHLICLLADGMGGHAAGDVAAETAILEFEANLSFQETPCHPQFIACLDNANRKLAEKASLDSRLEGMGCTFVGLEIIDGSCRWTSVGDSPLFHVRSNKIKRINADHSMASRLDAAARAGEITPEEALNSPSRNVLLSALTGDTINRLDHAQNALMLEAGDWLILASDGVETLSNQQLVDILAAEPPQTADNVLREIMNKINNMNKSGQDNATAIIIKVNKVPHVKVIDSDEITTRPVFKNK